MKNLSALALATLSSVAVAAVVSPQAGAAERVVRGPQWEDEDVIVTVTDHTSPAVDSVEHIEVVILPQENPERATPSRVVRGPQWESTPETGTAATTTTGGAQSVPETTTTTPAPAPAAAAPAEGQPVSNIHAAAVSPRLVNAVATQPAPAVTTTTTAAVEQPVVAPQESAPQATQPERQAPSAQPSTTESDSFVEIKAEREAANPVAPAAPAAPVAQAEIPELQAPAEGGKRATVTITYPGGVAAANATDNNHGRVEVVTTHTRGGATTTDTWVSQATHTTWNVQRNGHEVVNLTVPAGYEQIAEDLGAKAEAAGMNPFVQPYGRHALRVGGVNIAGELKQA